MSRDPVEANKMTLRKGESDCAPGTGHLVVNADDWGRDQENTDRIMDCVRCRTVSSVSAMVFMEDSERAAALALERRVDVGLHLNFTTAFSSPGVSSRLKEHQQQLARYLLGHRFAQVMFHPGLTTSFRYVVEAQIEEFRRLYGVVPQRLDGHHHMHLCANVLLGRLLPPTTLVRRNFSFGSGERGYGNRLYRKVVDRKLATRHRLVDYFFSLPPLAPERLQRVFSLARQFTVEVETHPVRPDEYQFLAGGEIFRLTGNVQIADLYDPAQASGHHGTSDHRSTSADLLIDQHL
jgi:hypothetical protein